MKLEKIIKLGIIIETKEFEKLWNAMQFAVTSKKAGHDVKVFLMGEAVEIGSLDYPKYNVAEQVRIFIDIESTILACWTCLKSRNMDVCPLSTMVDCLKMVE